MTTDKSEADAELDETIGMIKVSQTFQVDTAPTTSVNATELKRAIRQWALTQALAVKPELTFNKIEGIPNTLVVDFTERHMGQWEQALRERFE